jgi:uncharacterized membrane protein
MSAAPSPPVAWEIALVRSWRKLALILAGALAVASLVWQATHAGMIYDFVFRPDAVSPEQGQARGALLPLTGIAAAVAAVLGARVLFQARRGRISWPIHRELLITSLMTVPLLTAPSAEFDHPWFVAAVIMTLGLAFAHTIAREVEARGVSSPPDLSDRQAYVIVGVGVVTFTAVMGFLAHWRFITFHAETCDASWEIGAISGILRHGVPTVSVAAWLYDGKPLPAPYFNNHVPFVDYLFVPFYAVYRDPRLLFWLQAAFMATGAFGAYLIGRRWLERRAGGVLLALLYLLNPSVQSFCLHDIHANIMTIPALLLAVGFMEAERPRLAVAFALLTAVCREEAPLYAAAIGLFWMLSARDRHRFRVGLAILGVSIALEGFFAGFLMPHFGGQPRQDHFSLYFDDRRTLASMLGALVLNPVGAAFASTSDVKLDYLAISLVPFGGLALLGWRMAWFTLPAALLLLPASDPTFFTLGVNYSAPLVPAALMMGFAGLRRVWSADGGVARRAGIATYVLTTALFANYLYGNVASKTYKFEYGQSPYRRESQRNYHDILGYLEALPPYGPTERALWDVIRHVPHDGPVLTSWAINPQLADHDVALVYGYSGGTPPPEERARYIVLDKLPVFQAATEPDILRLRRDARWEIFFENGSGVIFKRRAP